MKLTIYYDVTSIEQEVTTDEVVDFRDFILDNEKWNTKAGHPVPYWSIYLNDGDKIICIMRNSITSFVLDK